MAVTDMLMPKMGESIAEATIVRWTKKVGDAVKKDEIVLEISTDKVDSEVPSPVTGVIQELLYGEDDTVEVGTVIAKIAGEGAAPGAATGGGESAASAPNPAPAPEPVLAAASSGVIDPRARIMTVGGTTPVPRSDGKRFYSPVVRAIAKDKGISLEEISGLPGSGKDGRVTRTDLLAYLDTRTSAPSGAPVVSAPAPAVTVSAPAAKAPAGFGEKRSLEQLGLDAARVEVVKMNTIRKAIFKGMRNTIDTAAHVQQVHEVDITRIVKFRESIKKRFKAEYGFNLTYTAFMIEAATRALEAFPMVNSQVNGDEIILKKYVNFGVAVVLPNGGLIVPNIKNTQDLNLVGIARAVADLGERARTGKLSPDDTAGGSFTLTNVGSFGPLFGMPLINQPESAIMGAGKIVKRPVMVDEGMWGFRDMIYLSLSFDHRIVDGALAGQFMTAVEKELTGYDVEALGLDRRLS